MITKISNGRIIAGERIIEGKSIYFCNGVITAVTEDDLPFDTNIDAGGNFVSAGFIDLHTHGALGGDFADGDIKTIVSAANFHCAHGTTTIFPTTLSASAKALDSALCALKEAVSGGEILPTVAGAHLEGPYFSKNQCGAQNPDFITPPVKKDYIALLQKHSDIIARWSFAPELEGSEEFVEDLNKFGVISSIGHTDATYDDVMAVYNKGCRLITHFYSCTSTMTRRNAFRIMGVVESGYLLDDMAVEAIADGCHILKDLFRLLYKIKGADNICLVTDSMSCCGIDREVASIGGVPCKIKNGVAYLMDESAFAGSIATADRLVRFCYKTVGIDIANTIKMITETPARVMGLDKKGKIQKGFDADIVIFDDDINIKNVFAKGKQV